MKLGRTRQSQAIRDFRRDAVRSGNQHFIEDACAAFSISRRSVLRQLAVLTERGYLEQLRGGRAPSWQLGALRRQVGVYALNAIDHSGGTEVEVYAYRTSRAFDVFVIQSRELRFTHLDDEPTDLPLEVSNGQRGTVILRVLATSSRHSLRAVFDAYTDPGTPTFSRTLVPVRLALYEGEQLVSRSQAKRIMNRVDHMVPAVEAEVRRVRGG